MASHNRNHHRSASMAASTSAASSSSHNNNFASTSSSRYMNHPNHSTASIHVSNPSTTNSASARIRLLWQTFERAAANGRSTMEHKVNAATSKADADYKKTPIQQRTLTPSQHEERKLKLAQQIKEGYFDSVRTDWLARLSGAGLNPEEWTDMTEGEMKSVARVLGDDDGGAGDGDDSDGSIEESDEELVFVQNKSGFPMANAPSMMSASMRSSNVSTSTTSSYAVVNPSEFHSEEGDGDYFFNPASVMATSHDLTSDDDDGYMSQSHHSHASYTQHTTASNHFGSWSHNASSDSLNSSHSNHNAGYFSATSSTSASRPAPLTSTASYSAQAHQQQPNTPRNSTFPSSGGSAWAASQNQKAKVNSQFSSSASMYPSNAATGTSSKPDTDAVVAPKPRQVYIGPHILDDESGTADATNTNNPGSNDADRENDDATGFSSDEEADFEVFKMRTRMLKIVEFHQAAALAEIKLAVGIYEDRRKALSSSAAAKAPQSSSTLLTNANPIGKNRKTKVNGKENADEDAGDASRSAERVSISVRLADHEKKMIQLQKEKEEERKEMVREERRRRRGEIELKEQSTVNVNGPTLNGAGKGRGRSGTATASTPAMRRGSISAILGTNNNSAPITSSAPNNTGNAKSRPGRSGTLIGANNSRPVAPPASAPTPAPMPAPKASAPVHPAWLDNFGNAEEEQEVDEEDIKGRLEEPFNLGKILSGEDSVDKLIGNMLGSGGRSGGLVNGGHGTTKQGTDKGKGKQSPPTTSQQTLRTGMSSASSSAASSIYNGSMGGKRRMSDAASIASGTSGINAASGMMKGSVSGNGNTNKKKIRAPKMQKKASLFGDSDSDDEDEDGWGSESGEESTSPSPPVDYYTSNADAILASELMQDPITAAQIQHYLGASSGAKSNGAAGGLGRGSGFGFSRGMEDGMDDGLGALAAEFGVAGIVGGMGMGSAMGVMNGMGRGREGVFGGVASNATGMGGMSHNMGADNASSGFGYESWGAPPPKSTKLMASSSSASQNSTSQNMWGNQVAANSTANLGSTLHAPVATPPAQASNLLSSKGAGRATPMPTAPTPSGWKRLAGNVGVGRSAPTPQPQAQPQPQIPGLAPHQAQVFLQSQLQAQQQAQFGFNSPNMNDPYALAAAALEATLNGNNGNIPASATARNNPFSSGSGSGYASSSGNGYLSSSSAMGARNKLGGGVGKKASPFGSDDEDEVDSGSAGVWGAVMNRGANGKEKKVTTGLMMGSMMNSFAQSQQQQVSTVKGKSKMTGWGVAAPEQEQTQAGDGEDGWGLEYQNNQQEEDEEDSMWGAPKKVPAKSAVNGKKVASSSIMNINANSNARALKEKLEKEKAEKERAEEERLEKEELEKAKAAEKEKAAQPPAPALTGSTSKKQTKKQKQAAKKGGAAAASIPEPEPEPREPTPPPSPPSPPPPEPTSVSLMSRILPGKGRGRKESMSMLSASTPALSGATATATVNSTSTSNASGGGLFGSWDEKDNSAMSNSFSSMSLSTPKQTSKVPSSLLSQQQQQQPDEFGAGFGFGTTPKQGHMFKSSGAASTWGSAINANTSSTIRASNANSGTTGKGSLWGMFGGGGDKSAATQSSSLSIPGGFDDVDDRDDGGGEEGEEESKLGEWEEPACAWGASTKKGVIASSASSKPAISTAAQRLRRMSEATSTPTPPPAPVPEPSPPAPSPVTNTNAGGKKGKGKKGAKATTNNTSPVIATVTNKSLKPTIEVLPDEDDDQVRGDILPSDSKHIMEDADGDVGLDLVGGVTDALGGDEKRVEALMKELRETEAKLGGVSGAGAGAGKNTTNTGKSPWGVKSTENVFGAKGSVATPAAASTPVWGQAARRGKAGAGGKLF